MRSLFLGPRCPLGTVPLPPEFYNEPGRPHYSHCVNEEAEPLGGSRVPQFTLPERQNPGAAVTFSCPRRGHPHQRIQLCLLSGYCGPATR